MTLFAVLMIASTVSSCDLSAITSDRAAHDAFARRAVEIVTLAALNGKENEGRLQKLIDPSAPFGLGGGDVGVPLGVGVSGAKAMAQRMNADQYRYLGWDYMVGPANGCDKGEVDVDFIDSANGEISEVKFTFEKGRVVSAQGWQRSFQTGSLPSPNGR